jgi:hypothetical protein
MGIDTTMLNAMRSAIGQLLPDTCNILSLTDTPDGEGGVSTAWGTSGTAINCRLDVKQGREQVSGGAIEPFTSYMLSLPYDTLVAYNNRVQMGTITYTVKGVNLNQSWNAVKRIDLEKI